MIDSSVARDIFRCELLDEEYDFVVVHTVHKCSDLIRCDGNKNEYDMNCDCCTRHFLKDVRKRNWHFNEIYLDTVRMPENYLIDRFPVTLANNLIALSREGRLHSFGTKVGTIYIPFCAHFFHMFHSSNAMKNEFDISYIRHHEISRENHKLAYVTKENMHRIGQNEFYCEQEKYITSTRKNIIGYSSGLLMDAEKLNIILEELEPITEIRYIVLKQKELVTTKPQFHAYFISVLNRNFLDKQFKSIHFKVTNNKYLCQLAVSISKKLIVSTPNSSDGISITVDKPGSNKPQLNIVRPAVLRQNYGMNLKSNNNNTTTRYAYGLSINTTFEGTDPLRIQVKPFSYEMDILRDQIMGIISVNRSNFNLEDVNLEERFNSCMILLYYTKMSKETLSNMGFHCDSKYSKNGIFLKSSNTQLENTPVVIFTIGSSRYLHWRKRHLSKNEKGHCVWTYDNNYLDSMLLEHGHLCLINPQDEMPHVCAKLNKISNYQHGNVKYKGDGMSIAFVF